MTKDEFFNEVVNLTDISEADFLIWGIKMKQQLPQSQRDWQLLTELMQYDGTANSYRKRVDRYLAQHGHDACEALQTLDPEYEPTAPQAISGTNVQTNRDENPEKAKLGKNYIDKQQLRDWYTAYRRGLRDDARIQTLAEEIKTAAGVLKPLDLRVKNVKYQAKKNTEAILMLSDWHIGQEANNFYNTYNAKVAKERVDKLAAETIHYCELYGVDTLHILNLGDLIEGLIHVNARVEQQMDVAEQLTFVGELLANFLVALEPRIPHITYRSVTDNHSRIVADTHQHIEKENFGRLVDWFLKERLGRVNSSIKMIQDNLDIGLGLFSLRSGLKVAFMHGHEDQKSKILQNVVGATHEWVDVVCCGHYHNPAEHTFQDMKFYINGSLCGTGPYALKNRLFATPSQKLLIFDNNICDIDIGV